MAYKNKDVYKFKDINEDKDYLSAKQNADQYGEYKSSDKVTGLFDNAYNILNNQKPEKWDADIMSKDYLEKLNAWQNRPNFSYDVNGDALYQQYKDQYINQGRMAMMDTMGQAAAMTGGYGNSYAATVGNQAYQGQLQKLNEIVPELYSMAYNMYQQEGEDLKYAAEIAHRDYLQKYTENQDAYRNWNSDVNTAFAIADTESAKEQGIWELNSTAANNALNNAINMFNTKEANEFAAYNADMQENQWYESYLVQERQADAAEEANKIASQAKQGGLTKEMTAAEIAAQLQAYKDNEDDVGLSAFLDILEADGVISGEQADIYYDKYVTKKETPTSTAWVRGNPLLGIPYTYKK